MLFPLQLFCIAFGREREQQFGGSNKMRRWRRPDLLEEKFGLVLVLQRREAAGCYKLRDRATAGRR